VLATCLGEAAGLAGIAAFTGEVLSENRRALGFIRALAPRLEWRLHGPTTEVVCWLSPDPAPGRWPGRSDLRPPRR
jgi:hypothetical protein